MRQAMAIINDPVIRLTNPHGDKNHSHARKVFNACPANHSSAVVDFKNGVKKSGIIDYKN